MITKIKTIIKYSIIRKNTNKQIIKKVLTKVEDIFNIDIDIKKMEEIQTAEEAFEFLVATDKEKLSVRRIAELHMILQNQMNNAFTKLYTLVFSCNKLTDSQLVNLEKVKNDVENYSKNVSNISIQNNHKDAFNVCISLICNRVLNDERV